MSLFMYTNRGVRYSMSDPSFTTAMAFLRKTDTFAFASAEAFAQVIDPNYLVAVSGGYFLLDGRLKKKPKNLANSPVALRLVVAKTSASKDALKELANDPDLEVRHAVANNRHTPDEYKDKALVGKLVEVASNPSTPVPILVILAKYDDFEVRGCVAANKNTPDTILDALSLDDEFRVRQRVAENVNLSMGSLLRLVEDPQVRDMVISHPKAPRKWLREFATDPNRQVRMAVAKNEHTPVDVLEKLTDDSDFLVLLAVAENKNTPSHSLQELTQVRAGVRHFRKMAQNVSEAASERLAALARGGGTLAGQRRSLFDRANAVVQDHVS